MANAPPTEQDLHQQRVQRQRNIQFDASTKEIFKERLMVLALLSHWNPDWFRELGLLAPEEITSIEVTSVSWHKRNPESPGHFVSYTNDGLVVLRIGTRVKGLLALEFQERNDPSMPERLEGYALGAVTRARDNGWLDPDTKRLPPLCIGVVHTGTTEWPAMWMLQSRTPPGLFAQPTLPVLVLDVALTYQNTPDTERAPPLTSILDAYVHLEVVRHRILAIRGTLNSLKTARAFEDVNNRVVSLVARSAYLMGQVRVMLEALGDDGASCLARFWNWFEVALYTPCYLVMERLGIEDPDFYIPGRNNIMHAEMVAELDTALQTAVKQLKDEGRKEGRDEGRKEGMAQGWMDVAHRYGAFTPQEVEAYQAKIASLPAAQIPSVLDAVAYLQGCLPDIWPREATRILDNVAQGRPWNFREQ